VSGWDLVAFNVLLNGVGSFAVAWLICRAARRFLQRSPTALVALSALPFAKIAFDAARGVPDGSFLWERAAGRARDLGSLQVGVGIEWGVPRVQLAFGAIASEKTYTESAPDLVAGWLTTRVSPLAPGIAAGVLVAISMVLLARAAHGWWEAARAARALRRAPAALRLSLGTRRIPVYIVDDEAQAPYTGGLFRPYVVFSRLAWSSLPVAEREAALAHELGHIAHRHLAVWAVAELVATIFWFVPGIRSALRGLRASFEGDADRWALRRGVAPAVLASALVRVKELSFEVAAPAARLAVLDASLPARVAALLDADTCSAPPSRARRTATAVLACWVAATVFAALAFGNH
jgi:beta-lactamase regulating signal transducer with metallopeptidase domain